MLAIMGTVKGGQVVLDEPAGLPDGTRVAVRPAEATSVADEGPMTPEEIEATLAAMSRIEPLDVTPEEEARWKADLKSQREYDETHSEARSEKLRRMWE